MKRSGSWPKYAILGRGRWAKVMGGVLAGEGRRVDFVGETRRRSGEDDDAYVGRLQEALEATGAEVGWLCVPPGPHVRLMVEAVIRAGLHTVVEKPWLCAPAETQKLSELARHRVVRVGVHYQFCLLDGVGEWRRRFHDSAELGFGGRFLLSRPDRLGIAAVENLGSHLLAIREYATPGAELLGIECGYEAAVDERRVWLRSHEGREVAVIDFTENREPLIQRYVRAFEASGTFAFDLEFALRVNAWRPGD